LYVVKVEKGGYFYKEEEGKSKKVETDAQPILLRKQVQPQIQDNKIVLNDIPFGFDQATITTVGARELDRLVAFMREHQTMRILIVAHTDQVGKAKYNKKLSQARADATAQYLYDQGIDAQRVETKGMGSSEPKVMCKTCTDEENQQNRRSEFVILQR